jgi:phosphoribosyl 1,2-cyclic phosphodiesterase
VCYNGCFRRKAIVRVCVLGSGSSGNCTLVATERTRLLVDAGLSRREICRRLVSIGEDPERISAVLVTHEHSDHISGLPVLARKLDIPVYMTQLAAPGVDWGEYVPKLETFQAGTRFTVGDIEVQSFTIPHDAMDPVGFCFTAEGVRVGVATDLGYIPDSVRFHLRGTDLLVLEANHDLEMLKVGPYPWSVKQRVMGRKGHLSNDVACDFIRDDLDTTTSTLVLGHLSENNNHPAIVRLAAEQALAGRRIFTKLVIAGHDRPTDIFDF